jgi:hypothetical protein
VILKELLGSPNLKPKYSNHPFIKTSDRSSCQDAGIAAIIYRSQYEQQEPTSRMAMPTLRVAVLAYGESATLRSV